MKKILSVLLTLALILSFTTTIGYADVANNVASLEVTNSSLTDVSVSGTTTDASVYAVTVQIVNGSTVIANKSFEANSDKQFSGTFDGLSLAYSTTYTVRAANYEGGAWKTATFTTEAEPYTPPVYPYVPSVTPATTVKVDTDGSATVVATGKDAEISKSTIENITKEIVVTTQNCTVEFDTAAVQTIKDAVKNLNSDVKLVAKQVKSNATEIRLQFELTVNGKKISDFNAGTAKVTVKVPYGLYNKELQAVYIDDNGKASKVDGVKNADGTYTMTLKHFSEYALMSAEEAAKILPKFGDEEVKELVKNFTVTTRTINETRGIKVYVNDVDGVELIKAGGYTVVYDFYNACQRAVPSNAKYKLTKVQNKSEAWYLNTAAKKGQKYYYKAVLKVKDADGNVVAKTTLEQAKYGCRTRK